MAPLFTDTTCMSDSSTSSWESMYNLFEEEIPMVVVVKKEKVDGSSSCEATLSNVAKSFLH